jgi:hypothetical protein
MAAGLVIPISGPYTGIYDNLTIGTLNDDGYELAVTIQGQEINETDAYGMTLVEAIYRGQNWRLRMRGLEWLPGLLWAMQTFGAQAAKASGLLGPRLQAIGDRWSTYSRILILTALLSNPPTVPQVLTADSAVIAPQQQSTFNLTSKMRELPIEMVLLPYHTTVGSVSMNVPFEVQ